MAKKGYRKNDDPNYSQENNKVNLDTNVTAFGKILYYLKVANDNQPLQYYDAQNKIFPQAKQAIGSDGDPGQPDEHAVRVLNEFNLIQAVDEDQKSFNVSELGKRFLEMFTYEKVPDSNGKLLLVGQVSRQEQLEFFFDLMSGVNIVTPKYGRDIRPYVCLMRFLVDPRLGGFIRKNEWALFLNSSDTLTDAQYDAYVVKIRDFRISCSSVGHMKKMERTLSRFVEPGVLTEVGGSGENTAYELSPEFAEIVKHKYLKDSDQVGVMTQEQRFVDWAQTQDSIRTGEKITLAVAKHYAGELRDNLKDPKFSGISVNNIFDVDNAEDFVSLRDRVVNVVGFADYDDSGYFSRALKLYGLFLEETEKMSINHDSYLAAIRTKPFVLLAGISGTGKSRMVRQLARGCCPNDSALAWEDEAKTKPAKKPGNFEMIPVRPNWHDSTELMGYVTRLTDDHMPKYVITPFVKFLVKAWQHKDVPFFLCLDEMNLAPVEQYFAEYLSKIETRKLENGEITTDVLVEFSDKVIDGVLVELAREIPSLAISKQAAEDAKSEWKKRDKDSLHKLWEEFLAEWPISRLRGITLEEYTKAGSTDTFTYALEAKLSKLGSIWGGSAFKFGIYSRDPNGKMVVYKDGSKQMGTAEYAWYRKYGQTKDAAWSVVKESVIAVAEAAAKGDFAAVEKIDLPHVVKWKIAFLYQDRNNIQIVDIFKREWIVLLTQDMPKKTSFADRYLKLNGERGNKDVFEWDDDELSKRIADELSSDGDIDEDGEEESVDNGNEVLSPVLEMIKRDKGIRIPPNLVVMGTVNMDETTCSFSRKVLDRAMTFELNEVDMDAGLETDNSVPYGAIQPDGAKATAVEGFDFYAANKDVCEKIKIYLNTINAVLNGTPFKFAYRSRNEIMLYCIERMKGGVVELPQALDEATSMKVLSRIEGDEQKLRIPKRDAANNVVKDANGHPIMVRLLDVLAETIPAALKAANSGKDPQPACTVCTDKLTYMAGRLDGGFTNFFV